MMAPLGLALTLAFGQLVFPAPPTHPTVAELQPLVGEPVTSTAASEVLGTAATVDGEAGPWRWHRFPALGVTARVDAVAGTIALLVLHGARGKGHGRYEVALPEGLTFGHDQAQVRDQLGEPTVKQSRLRRWEYWERGLDVVFRSGGRNIKEVHVRAELPPGSAEVRLAKPRVISNPARAPVALSVDVQSRVTPGDAVGRLLLHVELETADGQRVACASDASPFCGPDGQLRATSELPWKRARLRVGERRIPLRALKLPPGEHVLTPVLSAAWESEAEPGAKDQLAHPAPVVTSGLPPFEFTMPRVSLVRFRVKEVVLKSRVYDRNTPLPGYHLADVAWLVTDRTVLRPITYHASATRPDTTKAKWKVRTPWLPIVAGESLRLLVVDRDVSGDEELLVLPINAETLRHHRKAGRLNRTGDVQELLIDRIEVR